MAESSRFWDGSSVGDSSIAPYDAEIEFAEVMRDISMTGYSANQGGVWRTGGASGGLLMTGIASPVSVAAGRAIIYGSWYNNSTSFSVTIPTPVSSTRIDRLVIRKDWAAQTCRAVKIAGTEGAGAPALVQNSGVQWDIPIAQISITTGGVITVTDQRELIPGLGHAINTPFNSPIKFGEVVVGVAGLAAIDFTSIPAGYRTMVIDINGACDAPATNTAASFGIQFNSDLAATHYQTDQYYDNGGNAMTVNSAIGTYAAQLLLGTPPGASGADCVGHLSARIIDYAGTTFNKLVRATAEWAIGHTGAVGPQSADNGGIWLSSAAITSVHIFPSGGGATKFTQGTVATLYLFP